MDNNRLERIEDKIDKISEHMNETNVILGKQHESLKEHIRRTELLEHQVEPIKRHVAMVNGALKLLGVLATIATIIRLLTK